MGKKYDIAAYIWPAYTGDEPRTRIFWEEGFGEWQTVKNVITKGNDYTWNRQPVWGYQNEADPYVMQMQIEAATDHGVNVFIYDWYWYDERPFLEQCLNNGFLQAPNNHKMQFYIMWANHDANYMWNRRLARIGRNETVWKGAVSFDQFKIIGRRWLDQYFKRDNYYKIDGKPVVSIYEMHNFVSGLGGVEKATEAMNWLRNEAIKEGLAGVHFQFIRWRGINENFSGVDGNVIETGQNLVRKLGFESLTHYQFIHFTNMDRDYAEIIIDVEREWERISDEYAIPYFPHVSVGWDNNPRLIAYRDPVIKNNTPEIFEKALRKAKDFADKTGVKLITFNSWNEWTETSYLQPDNVYGYGYLEAVRKVFKEE